MTEQEENELICEKLLGWKPYVPDGYEAQDWRWKRPVTLPGITGEVRERTPSFKIPAEAALILEILRMRGTVQIELDLHFADVRFQDIRCVEFEFPAAVRAVALQVIGQLPASSSTPTPP